MHLAFSFSRDGSGFLPREELWGGLGALPQRFLIFIACQNQVWELPRGRGGCNPPQPPPLQIRPVFYYSIIASVEKRSSRDLSPLWANILTFFCGETCYFVPHPIENEDFPGTRMFLESVNALMSAIQSLIALLESFFRQTLSFICMATKLNGAFVPIDALALICSMSIAGCHIYHPNTTVLWSIASLNHWVPLASTNQSRQSAIAARNKSNNVA